MKDCLGREKLKSEGSCGRKNTTVSAEEVTHLIGTGIATGIMIGRGTGIEKEIVNMRDIMIGMVEETGKGGEGQIGRT